MMSQHSNRPNGQYQRKNGSLIMRVWPDSLAKPFYRVMLSETKHPAEKRMNQS